MPGKPVQPVSLFMSADQDQSERADDSLGPQLIGELEERHRQGLYRRRAVIDSPQGVHVVIDGCRLLNFSSNDYLGLANHPRVVEALRDAATRYGVGSGASHLIAGHARPHHYLEEELADFLGRQRVLLFSTGYMANLAIASSLSARGDTLYEDRLNHASLVDAALLSRARLRRYRHADVGALERHLAADRARRKLVLTDGVFSMDGDMAPLSELLRLAARYQLWLMVDDAHGIGVLGSSGRGSLEHLGLDQRALPVLMGTLGKAFGTFGAFVAAGETVIETLIQQARPYIYTTALPPAVAAATRVSLRLIREESWRREKLHALVQRFRQGARDLALPLLDSATPIQPVVLGDSARAVRAAGLLRNHGIFVMPIRPPTVPEGTARLRLTFSAAHENEHVDRLLYALDEVRL